MSTLDTDLDLRAACRTRDVLLDEIEHAEHRLHSVHVDSMLTTGVLGEPPAEAARVAGLARDLSALDRRIAEVVTHHMMHPVTLPAPFMVLRTGSHI